MELVVDDAIAPADMATNGRVPPSLAIWAGNVIAVEIGGDGLGALASGEFTEDGADDLGLVDLPFAAHLLAIAVEAFHDVIAIAEAATPPFPFSTRPRRPRWVLAARSFRNRAFIVPRETDMELGDFALSERHERDTGKYEMLVENGDIGPVAADEIQRFRQHDLELARLRVLQERLDARPQGDAGTRIGGVLVGPHHLPLLPRRLVLANAELVLDGGNALIVRGIAGV